jgi:uncharacterized membrane protein YhhN
VLPFVLFAAAAVLVLLVAEARGWLGVGGIAKGVASSSFVAAALALRAHATPYGRVLLLALALSWVGDLLLLSRQRAWFLAGLAAFLGAHLAYATAFVLAGIDWRAVALALVPVGVFAALVARWLLPAVDGSMRGPVVAYMAALSTMVALAAGTAFRTGGSPGSGQWLVLAAAVAFLLSDLSVARDRFVAPGIANQLWGLPLYYAAQLAFAATAGAAAAGAAAGTGR